LQITINTTHLYNNQCGMPPQYAPAPCKLTFDLESGVRVTCDVGYLCANFSLPRPLFSSYARCTRQTDIRQTRIILGAGA